MRKMFDAAAALAMAVASPLSAQDTEEASDSDDDVPTLLAYLGLSAMDGSNTVGEGAGSIEGHMLASVMAIKAAQAIVTTLEAEAKASAGPVILLAGSESFSLGEYYQAERQLELLDEDTKRFLAAVARSRCLSPGTKAAPLIFDPAFAMIEGVPATERTPKFDFQPSDFLGAFRTSTSLSPVSVTLGAQLFKNAVLAQSSESFQWVLPSEIAQPTGGDSFFEAFGNARQALIPYADGKCDKTDEAIGKVAKGLLARADALAASKEGAPSLLDKAAVAASIMQGGLAPKVLRVDVDKAGGTLVNSSNVFTSLGVPGITMRGGMVVTYRMVDPQTGRSEASGVVLCRMPKKLLMTLTQKDLALEDFTCQAISAGGT